MKEFDALLAYLEKEERLREARNSWSPELRQQAEEWKLQIARDRATSYMFGREAGLREALRKILYARFSTIPAALEARVASARLDTLSDLIDHALHAESINDM